MVNTIVSEAKLNVARLTTSAGAVYQVPTYQNNGQLGPITLTPQEPFDQVNMVGDTSQVSDRRASQIIPTDQRGGAGTDMYNETEGVTTYRQSDADPRFEGALVCRPKRTSLGTLASFWEGQRVVYVGYTNAKLHSYYIGGLLQYHLGTGTVWTTAASIGGATPGQVFGHAKGLGYTWACGNDRIWRTTDGINFTGVAAGVFAYVVRGLAIHDNKVWTVGLDTVNSLMLLLACANPTAAAGACVWTTVASIPMQFTVGSNETFVKLVAWRDASGSPALVIVTTTRVLMYNPVGATIEEYDDFSENNPDGGAPAVEQRGIDAITFKTDNNLYVAQGLNNDYLMRYSAGAGFGKISPNMGGGLDTLRQGSPRALAQNAYGLGVWTYPTAVVGGVSNDAKGGAWFMQAEGGWHCLNRDLTALSNIKVYGGGIGGRKFWTVFSTGLVEEQDLPSVGSRPQFAIGRKYDTTNGQIHYYAATDGGTELLRSTLLGFTVHCRKSDGTNAFGLDNNTSFIVRYRVNGGAWVVVTDYEDSGGVTQTIGTGIVTNAIGANFPVRMVVGGHFGVVFNELEWSIEPRTSDENSTPVIVTCAPRYLKTPPPHYVYEFVVDLAQFQLDRAGGPLPMPNGRSVGSLLSGLELMDALGPMVKLEYSTGRKNYAVKACEFAMAPQHLPHLGAGRYRISLKDVASDKSGTQ